MPKRQAQRIIDNRSANRNPTTISGITLTSPDTAYTAGDGLTLTGVVLAVGAGDGISVAADAVAVDSTVVRTTRTVTAGSGLTGGGALSADLTLNVGAGTLITVGADTVGITAGANYQYIGTGSGTAAAWQNLSGLAGAGLTHSAGVLAVGAGNGITVNADNVALTTPGTLTVATSNSSTGNHTHALATSSNPGAAASILASDANGYLQLVRIGLGMAPTKPLSVSGDAGISGNAAIGSLSVSGAATVGQDFTVGANVLYVNQSGTRVGINRAPDSQFDLDVAGAIRGQYLIGKHAIQLASAVGVWHFDGAAPYNLDFGGSDASHAGVGGTAAGGVIYRPGKFGKAVQVAPATTNLCTNPSFETDTTGWGTDYPAATTLTRVADGWVGAYFLRVAATGTGNFYSPAVTVANNTAYAASFWYRTTATVLVRVVEYGTSTNFGLATLPAVTEWTRYTILLTTPASGSSTIRIVFSGLEAGEIIDIDAVQVEQADAATPYCDGSLGNGHSWSGTAHASTSSRTGATLTYPVGIGFDAAEGSILMWVRLAGLRSAGMGLFGTGSTAQFDAYINSSGSIYFRQNNVALSYAAAIAAGAWHLLGFTWSQSGNVRTIYVDGVAVATRQFDAGATIGSDLYVGSLTAGSPYSVNGLIDEFVLTDYAMDAKLVRAIYESDAPVFVESSVFHWRSPSRVPIWVDEFGLWARGVSGNEILGLYGGDPRNPTGNVTHSWGGVTMEENDIVIGRAAQAAVHWDDSVGSLMIGRSSASNLLLSSGQAQMRDGTTVWGSWSLTGMVIGRIANSTSRLEITSSGNINIINRNSSGVDTTAISLSSGGSASFTGSITSSSGTIGGWTIGSNLSATNLMLTPGAANTAHILAGTGSTAGGINSAASGSDIVMWAGATHSNRASAAFRVTAAGALVASSATLTGGSISGVLTIGTSGEIRQGTGTLGTDFTGLRVLQSSNIGQIAIYDNNAKTMRISSDDVRFKMASAFADIRTIKWLEDTDYSGSWSDLSSANGNYAYIGAYYTSTNSYLYLSSRVNNTGSPANTRYSAIWLVPSRNESSTIYSNSLALYTFNATYSYEGAAIFTGMYLDLGAVSTPTRPLTQSSNAQVYIKGGNLVVRYNDGGTIRYKYLNLAGTGTSWTHTTTPP